jgi:hypothetical protein
MPQAQITINAVAGSNTDLPIDTLVSLDNNNIGGELTFNWTILDQPPGPADALSSAIIQNPTFTPKKEGTYLIRLVVNQGMGDEQIDVVVGAVRQVKTRFRIAAAGETIEADASDGWATDLNEMWRAFDAGIAQSVFATVGRASVAGLVQGDVLKAVNLATIKAGLPGEEQVLDLDIALATVPADIDDILFVLERGVDGSVTPALGDLIQIKSLGVFSQEILGTAVVGDPVFVSDVGKLSLTPGTNTRKVGSVVQTLVGPDRFRAFITGGLPVPLAVAAPVDVDAAPAAVGVSLFAARADHKHDVLAGAPTTILPDDVPAIGAGPALALADHVHGIVSAAPADIGIANAEGAAGAFARSDHVHRGQLLQVITRRLVSDITRTLSTFAAIFSQAITLSAGTILEIQATVGWRNTTNGTQNRLRITIDGTVFEGVASDHAASQRQGVAVQERASGLGAGAHTVALEWATSGGTAAIAPITNPDTEHAVMIIKEWRL